MKGIPNSRELHHVRQLMNIIVAINVAEASLVIEQVRFCFFAKLCASNLLSTATPLPIEDDEYNRGSGLLVTGEVEGTISTSLYDIDGERE